MPGWLTATSRLEMYRKSYSGSATGLPIRFYPQHFIQPAAVCSCNRVRPNRMVLPELAPPPFPLIL